MKNIKPVCNDEIDKLTKEVDWVFSSWNPRNWYWAKPSRYYRRLKIVLTFIKLGWNWNGWDYSHIWPVLRYMIQDIHNDLVSDEFHYQELHIEDTRRCIEIIDRLIANRYALDDREAYINGEPEQDDIDELFEIIKSNIRYWWT